MQLSQVVGQTIPLVDAVIPVPTSDWRRMQRGFDHIALLAQPVADALGVPLCHGLERINPTPQVGLTDSARQSNARAAFRVRARIPPTVLLVDDVVTTGATTSACATSLLQEGAGCVFLLCAASANRPRSR